MNNMKQKLGKRYKLQPNDLVRFNGKEYRNKGASDYGRYARISDGKNTIDVNIKNIKVINYGKGLMFN